MRILIAAEMYLNPYIGEPGRGYAANGCEVVFGVQNFWTSFVECDALHLHWPEFLFPGGLKSPNRVALRKLGECLDNWRRRVPIIATAHNLHPHRIDDAAYREAYRLVYEAADMVVHHGQSSVQLVADQYPIVLRKSLVIPHGHYAFMDSGLSRDEARKELGLNKKYKTLILSVGRIRSREEF